MGNLPLPWQVGPPPLFNFIILSNLDAVSCFHLKETQTNELPLRLFLSSIRIPLVYSLYDFQELETPSFIFLSNALVAYRAVLR